VSRLIDEGDLGRGVTSSTKLVKTAAGFDALAVVAGGGSGMLRGEVFDMDLHPTDPTRILLACSDGRIGYASRLGETLVPDSFMPPNDVEAGGMTAAAAALIPPSLSNAPATAVAFNPFLPTWFVAGFGDGRVALYATTHALPAKAWTAGSGAAEPSTASASAAGRPAVVAVRWLPTRPAAFVAVDERGGVTVWDLLASPATPVGRVELSGSWARAAASADAGAANAVVGVDMGGGGDLCPRTVALVATFTSGTTAIATFHPAFVTPRVGETAAARDAFAALL